MSILEESFRKKNNVRVFVKLIFLTEYVKEVAVCSMKELVDISVLCCYE